MSDVILEHVMKIYPGEVLAVNDASLHIADGQFVVLVGPSGCGKSTTLRMVAGLEEISGGTVRIGDRVVNDVLPKDRDIAMVFQDYALYPHMDVYHNMAFGLKLRKYPREEIDARVRAAAKILNLEPYLTRKPKALSGGQRQRVAVGRAIVRQPQVFLFDEPLSNLDAKLRVEMRAELKKLHRQLKTTTIYVTHDQEEAMTLGDRLVIMKDGVIQQVGSPLEVFRAPVNRFVAGFIGTPPMNFLDGTLVRDGDATFVDLGMTRVRLAADHAAQVAGAVGTAVVLGIRPEALAVRPEGRYAGRDNTLPTQLTVSEPLGEQADLYLTLGASTLVARVEAEEGLTDGMALPMHLDVTRLHLFAPGDTGRSLLAPAAEAAVVA
jgi:multiple sugar transport system ATP-binding protein